MKKLFILCCWCTLGILLFGCAQQKEDEIQLDEMKASEIVSVLSNLGYPVGGGKNYDDPGDTSQYPWNIPGCTSAAEFWILDGTEEGESVGVVEVYSFVEACKEQRDRAAITSSYYPAEPYYVQVDKVFLQVPKILNEQDAAQYQAALEAMAQGKLPEPYTEGTRVQDSTFVITPHEDGVAAFIKLQNIFKSSYKDDKCYNITPTYIADNSDYMIYKYNQSCESFLMFENHIYTLGTGFGGYGLTSLALADSNDDGKQELYFTFSYGSGIHRSQVGYFDPARSEVIVFEDSIMDKDIELSTDRDNNLCVFSADIKITSFIEFKLTKKDILYRVIFQNKKISLVPVNN